MQGSESEVSKAVMAVFIVSAHPGAVEWLGRRGLTGDVKSGIDDTFIAGLKPGDQVIGNLPAHLAATVTARGALFRAIRMNLTPEMREKRNLTADEMDACGAALVTIRAFQQDGDTGSTLPTWARAPARAQSNRATRRAGGSVSNGWLKALRGMGVMLGVALSAKLLSLTMDRIGELPELLGLGASMFADLSGWTAALPSRLIAESMLWWLLQIIGLLALGYGLWRIVLGFRPLAASFEGKLLEPRALLIQTVSPIKGASAEDIESRLAPYRKAGFEIVAMSRNQLKDAAVRVEAASSAHPQSGPEIAARLAEFKKVNERPLSWQQNIRTIAANLPRLERVMVMPSQDWDADPKQASPQSQADAFARFARDLLNEAGHGQVVVEVVGQPIDHENHDMVLATIEEALRIAVKTHGVTEKDIAIDGTAGLKMYSIAAAIATVNRPIVLHYATNTGDVNVYDGRIELVDPKWSATGSS